MPLSFMPFSHATGASCAQSYAPTTELTFWASPLLNFSKKVHEPVLPPILFVCSCVCFAGGMGKVTLRAAPCSAYLRVTMQG